MMKILLSLCAVMALSACATPFSVSPRAAADQESIFQNGSQAVLSEKENRVVAYPVNSVFKNEEGRAVFVVIVTNQSERRFDFSTDNVSAEIDLPAGPSAEAPAAGVTDTVPSTDPQPQLLAVINYEQLVAEEKQRQTVEAITAALNGFSRSMNASNAGYTNYSGTAYSGYDRVDYYGTTYNSAAASAAQDAANAQTQADFDRLKTQGDARMQGLDAILKRQTVLPGMSHGGRIVVQMPKPPEVSVPFRLRVAVGGEEHKFEYSVVKAPM